MYMTETHTQRISLDTQEIVDVYCSKHGVYTVEYSDGSYDIFKDHAALNEGMAQRLGRNLGYIKN